MSSSFRNMEDLENNALVGFALIVTEPAIECVCWGTNPTPLPTSRFLNNICKDEVHSSPDSSMFLKDELMKVLGDQDESRRCMGSSSSSVCAEMNCLEINLTKDSSLLLHAIHTLFYGRFDRIQY